MVSIYETLDYRFWVKAILDERQLKNSNFSLRLLAMKADCDAGTLSKVMAGKRHLSSAVASRIADVFGLDENEKEYLLLLVTMSKTKNALKKQEAYQKAMALRQVNSRTITADEHEYYSEWYHGALRNLLQIVPFYGKDHAAYGKKMCPPISALKVRNSIELLSKLGLIEQNEDGRYIIKELAVTSGENFSHLALRNFHKLNIRLAEESIERFEPSQRDVSYVTLNISPKDREIIRDKIRSFRKEIIEYVSIYADPKQIYQMNFQLFPMSEIEEDFDAE